MDAIVGIVLFVAAAVTSLVAPRRLSLILTIIPATAADSPGVNEVIVPAAYWAALILAAVLMSRQARMPLPRAIARVSVVAFATHMLLLLGASAERNLDRTAYATAIYWLYARAFYVAVIAASTAWVAQGVRVRPDRRLALAAVGPAVLVLVAMTVWRDPAAGIVGTFGGVAAGWRVAYGRPPAVFGRVRDWLADDRVVIAAYTPENFGIFADNMYFSTVPAPASAALLALSAMATGRRRRS